MTTPSEITLQFIIIVVLVLANGVLAMAELAIVSSRKSRLQQRAEEGDHGSKVALDLANEPSHLLSTAQVGITLIGVLAGAFGGATVAEGIAPYLARFALLAPWARPISFILVVLVITLLSVIIGELVPKRIALANAESLASALSRPMKFFAAMAYPVVRMLSWLTDRVLGLLGMKTSTEEPPVTEEEIKIMMEQGTEAGVFEEAEQDMVESVFRLGDRRVAALMTPRTEIVWLDVDDQPAELWSAMAESGYSYFPVYKEEQDNVLGIISVKDVWTQTLAGQSIDLTKLLTQPLFIPETTTALKLLEMLKKSKRHLALVVDEYGGIQGLVTLNDVLEAIVGDLPSEDEPSDQEAVRREDGSWLLDGMLSAEKFREIFGLGELPGEEIGHYQTIAGFIMLRLGHIPVTGEQAEWDGFRFEIVDMDGRRIDKVIVVPPSPPPAAPGTDADAEPAA